MMCSFDDNILGLVDDWSSVLLIFFLMPTSKLRCFRSMARKHVALACVMLVDDGNEEGTMEKVQTRERKRKSRIPIMILALLLATRG